MGDQGLRNNKEMFKLLQNSQGVKRVRRVLSLIVIFAFILNTTFTYPLRAAPTTDAYDNTQKTFSNNYREGYAGTNSWASLGMGALVAAITAVSAYATGGAGIATMIAGQVSSDMAAGFMYTRYNTFYNKPMFSLGPMKMTYGAVVCMGVSVASSLMAGAIADAFASSAEDVAAQTSESAASEGAKGAAGKTTEGMTEGAEAASDLNLKLDPSLASPPPTADGVISLKLTSPFLADSVGSSALAGALLPDTLSATVTTADADLDNLMMQTITTLDPTTTMANDLVGQGAATAASGVTTSVASGTGTAASGATQQTVHLTLTQALKQAAIRAAWSTGGGILVGAVMGYLYGGLAHGQWGSATNLGKGALAGGSLGAACGIAMVAQPLFNSIGNQALRIGATTLTGMAAGAVLGAGLGAAYGSGAGAGAEEGMKAGITVGFFYGLATTHFSGSTGEAAGSANGAVAGSTGKAASAVGDESIEDSLTRPDGELVKSISTPAHSGLLVDVASGSMATESLNSAVGATQQAAEQTFMDSFNSALTRAAWSTGGGIAAGATIGYLGGGNHRGASALRGAEAGGLLGASAGILMIEAPLVGQAPSAWQTVAGGTVAGMVAGAVAGAGVGVATGGDAGDDALRGMALGSSLGLAYGLGTTKLATSSANTFGDAVLRSTVYGGLGAATGFGIGYAASGNFKTASQVAAGLGAAGFVGSMLAYMGSRSADPAHVARNISSLSGLNMLYTGLGSTALGAGLGYAFEGNKEGAERGAVAGAAVGAAVIGDSYLSGSHLTGWSQAAAFSGSGLILGTGVGAGLGYAIAGDKDWKEGVGRGAVLGGALGLSAGLGKSSILSGPTGLSYGLSYLQQTAMTTALGTGIGAAIDGEKGAKRGAVLGITTGVALDLARVSTFLGGANDGFGHSGELTPTVEGALGKGITSGLRTLWYTGFGAAAGATLGAGIGYAAGHTREGFQRGVGLGVVTGALAGMAENALSTQNALVDPDRIVDEKAAMTMDEYWKGFDPDNPTQWVAPNVHYGPIVSQFWGEDATNSVAQLSVQKYVGNILATSAFSAAGGGLLGGGIAYGITGKESSFDNWFWRGAAVGGATGFTSAAGGQLYKVINDPLLRSLANIPLATVSGSLLGAGIGYFIKGNESAASIGAKYGALIGGSQATMSFLSHGIDMGLDDSELSKSTKDIASIFNHALLVQLPAQLETSFAGLMASTYVQQYLEKEKNLDPGLASVFSSLAGSAATMAAKPLTAQLATANVFYRTQKGVMISEEQKADLDSAIDMNIAAKQAGENGATVMIKDNATGEVIRVSIGDVDFDHQDEGNGSFKLADGRLVHILNQSGEPIFSHIDMTSSAGPADNELQSAVRMVKDIHEDNVKAVEPMLKIYGDVPRTFGYMAMQDSSYASFWSLFSMGPRPIVSAGIQGLVLAALNYKTYYGNHDSINGRAATFDNAMKSAIARAAGGFASDMALSSTETYWGSSRPAGMDWIDGTLKSAVTNGAGLGVDIAFAWMNKEMNMDMSTTGVNSLVHLAVAVVAGRSIDTVLASNQNVMKTTLVNRVDANGAPLFTLSEKEQASKNARDNYLAAMADDSGSADERQARVDAAYAVYAQAIKDDAGSADGLYQHEKDLHLSTDGQKIIQAQKDLSDAIASGTASSDRIKDLQSNLATLVKDNAGALAEIQDVHATMSESGFQRFGREMASKNNWRPSSESDLSGNHLIVWERDKQDPGLSSGEKIIDDARVKWLKADASGDPAATQLMQNYEQAVLNDPEAAKSLFAKEEDFSSRQDLSEERIALLRSLASGTASPDDINKLQDNLVKDIGAHDGSWTGIEQSDQREAENASPEGKVLLEARNAYLHGLASGASDEELKSLRESFVEAADAEPKLLAHFIREEEKGILPPESRELLNRQVSLGMDVIDASLMPAGSEQRENAEHLLASSRSQIGTLVRKNHPAAGQVADIVLPGSEPSTEKLYFHETKGYINVADNLKNISVLNNHSLGLADAGSFLLALGQDYRNGFVSAAIDANPYSGFILNPGTGFGAPDGMAAMQDAFARRFSMIGQGVNPFRAEAMEDANSLTSEARGSLTTSITYGLGNNLFLDPEYHSYAGFDTTGMVDTGIADINKEHEAAMDKYNKLNKEYDALREKQDALIDRLKKLTLAGQEGAENNESAEVPTGTALKQTMDDTVKSAEGLLAMAKGEPATAPVEAKTDQPAQNTELADIKEQLANNEQSLIGLENQMHAVSDMIYTTSAKDVYGALNFDPRRVTGSTGFYRFSPMGQAAVIEETPGSMRFKMRDALDKARTAKEGGDRGSALIDESFAQLYRQKIDDVAKDYEADPKHAGQSVDRETGNVIDAQGKVVGTINDIVVKSTKVDVSVTPTLWGRALKQMDYSTMDVGKHTLTTINGQLNLESQMDGYLDFHLPTGLVLKSGITQEELYKRVDRVRKAEAALADKSNKEKNGEVETVGNPDGLLAPDFDASLPAPSVSGGEGTIAPEFDVAAANTQADVDMGPRLKLKFKDETVKLSDDYQLKLGSKPKAAITPEQKNFDEAMADFADAYTAAPGVSAADAETAGKAAAANLEFKLKLERDKPHYNDVVVLPGDSAEVKKTKQNLSGELAQSTVPLPYSSDAQLKGETYLDNFGRPTAQKNGQEGGYTEYGMIYIKGENDEEGKWVKAPVAHTDYYNTPTGAQLSDRREYDLKIYAPAPNIEVKPGAPIEPMQKMVAAQKLGPVEFDVGNGKKVKLADGGTALLVGHYANGDFVAEETYNPEVKRTARSSKDPRALLGKDEVEVEYYLGKVKGANPGDPKRLALIPVDVPAGQSDFPRHQIIYVKKVGDQIVINDADVAERAVDQSFKSKEEATAVYDSLVKKSPPPNGYFLTILHMADGTWDIMQVPQIEFVNKTVKNANGEDIPAPVTKLVIGAKTVPFTADHPAMKLLAQPDVEAGNIPVSDGAKQLAFASDGALVEAQPTSDIQMDNLYQVSKVNPSTKRPVPRAGEYRTTVRLEKGEDGKMYFVDQKNSENRFETTQVKVKGKTYYLPSGPEFARVVGEPYGTLKEAQQAQQEFNEALPPGFTTIVKKKDAVGDKPATYVLIQTSPLFGNPRSKKAEPIAIVSAYHNGTNAFLTPSTPVSRTQISSVPVPLMDSDNESGPIKVRRVLTPEEFSGSMKSAERLKAEANGLNAAAVKPDAYIGGDNHIVDIPIQHLRSDGQFINARWVGVNGPEGRFVYSTINSGPQLNPHTVSLPPEMLAEREQVFTYLVRKALNDIIKSNSNGEETLIIPKMKVSKELEVALGDQAKEVAEKIYKDNKTAIDLRSTPISLKGDTQNSPLINVPEQYSVLPPKLHLEETPGLPITPGEANDIKARIQNGMKEKTPSMLQDKKDFDNLSVLPKTPQSVELDKAINRAAHEEFTAQYGDSKHNESLRGTLNAQSFGRVEEFNFFSVRHIDDGRMVQTPNWGQRTGYNAEFRPAAEIARDFKPYTPVTQDTVFHLGKGLIADRPDISTDVRVSKGHAVEEALADSKNLSFRDGNNEVKLSDLRAGAVTYDKYSITVNGREYEVGGNETPAQAAERNHVELPDKAALVLSVGGKVITVERDQVVNTAIKDNPSLNSAHVFFIPEDRFGDIMAANNADTIMQMVPKELQVSGAQRFTEVKNYDYNFQRDNDELHRRIETATGREGFYYRHSAVVQTPVGAGLLEMGSIGMSPIYSTVTREYFGAINNGGSQYSPQQATEAPQGYVAGQKGAYMSPPSVSTAASGLKPANNSSARKFLEDEEAHNRDDYPDALLTTHQRGTGQTVTFPADSTR